MKDGSELYVHLESCFEDFTLCGKDTAGDRWYYPAESTKDKIDCPACITLIQHCKSVKPTEYKNTKNI